MFDEKWRRFAPTIFSRLCLTQVTSRESKRIIQHQRAQTGAAPRTVSVAEGKIQFRPNVKDCEAMGEPHSFHEVARTGPSWQKLSESASRKLSGAKLKIRPEKLLPPCARGGSVNTNTTAFPFFNCQNFAMRDSRIERRCRPPSA